MDYDYVVVFGFGCIVGYIVCIISKECGERIKSKHETKLELLAQY